MLVVFSLTTGEFLIAGILPDVAADLAVSVSAAGLLTTAYAVGMIVGGPVVTALTARRARKPLIVGLVAVSLVGNLGSALAPNYPVLLVARWVAGLVVATFFAVAIATAVGMAPEGKQASTVAKVTLGMNLGIVLGTPLGTAVGHTLGWRASFAAVAAVSAVALLLVLRFLPAQPAAATGPVRAELRVFTSPALWWAIALTAVGNVGVVMVFTYIAPLLTEVSGFSATAIPVLLLVYGAGAVLGNFLGGWLADRALLPSLVGLLAVLVAVLALFWLVSPYQVGAAVLTFGLGVLAFAIIPGMQTRVLATAGAAPTLAVAVNASGFQLAAAFAGWLGGWVIGDGPGPRAVALVAALLTVVGLGIAGHALRQDRQPVTSA
ncbi:MFS transporter [Goodfellowiella coeruleoviolacea]|uniref:MFS transporter, DHA1 family, arabinose polymer transporter n=1 Tax=Goodfellowiella coeruleoviolacea TaxID=334858 RepID=A0AAE3GAP4_9PSEU|nr:MFS transporter [Goodfellowiella coeruleoviolacea]MCP2164801.1 MFS transporter, DHA1 family, arabinose polymer transporter [Goodfellowiella coeruleoviolacea]